MTQRAIASVEHAGAVLDHAQPPWSYLEASPAVMTFAFGERESSRI